ncbi:cysteine desulfurase family protein [Floricoccus penangensis]|uniref:cysteine desulfurase family protein n=1 Tax=Floricoccus penangensis TaxID=1859475 RepID=UPI00203B3060|nr:cysteine desulfurase family protein [Floricoccus penangensis]URZ87749.1 cysteine desulfurase [Floricoccus penangensis]
MIYFDNAATTKPYPQVLKTYTDVATRIWGNPSSLHSLGNTADKLLELSRKQIAELLNVNTNEIYFTSGGTESDNWLLKGTALEKEKFGKHIIVSAIEHPAIKESAHWLEKRGFNVDYAPVDKKGFINVDKLADLIDDDTTVVSIMAVNNEVGSIQPLKEIAELLSDKPNITFHVDAVQAIGKVPVEKYLFDRVDMASFSSHKFHGVRGVGLAYIKEGKKIEPLLSGGGQENNLRSTTENIAGIAATARALRLTLEDMSAKNQHLARMKEVIVNQLRTYDGVEIFSGTENFVPNIITFGIKGVRGEVLVHAFEEREIFISTTSACSSKAGSAASTLIAMNVRPEIATSAVRISLDEENSMAEVEQFLTVLNHLYDKFQKIR